MLRGPVLRSHNAFSRCLTFNFGRPKRAAILSNNDAGRVGVSAELRRLLIGFVAEQSKYGQGARNGDVNKSVEQARNRLGGRVWTEKCQGRG
jgi:hypothetical protein